ncbi:MAG: aminoacyl-tRNA hydrolase [Actinomycetota bacterium]|nr:aminoacyl-tRNA hydrolase [Actinomycetota bacterium]
MAEDIHITPSLTLPLEEVELRTSRSSGPGGQHANVTASRVEAVFDVEASATLSEEQRGRILARCGPRVTAVAQDARGQARNRGLALERLAEKLRRGLAVQRPRRATRPSAGARARGKDAKRRISQRKSERRRPDAE